MSGAKGGVICVQIHQVVKAFNQYLDVFFAADPFKVRVELWFFLNVHGLLIALCAMSRLPAC